MSAKWEIGQKVAKAAHSGNAVLGPFTVETISGKRLKITLSDGSEWGEDGRLWGRASERWYTGTRIVPWEDHYAEQADALKRRKASLWLAEKIAKADLTWDQINAMRAVLTGSA